MKHTLIIVAAFLFSCNTGNKNSDHLKADTSAFVPAPIADTSKETISLTAFEIKDDSIFTDGTIPTAWVNAGITDVRGLKVFIKEMQQYIMNNDKKKLAAAARYPLNNIKNEQELIEKYDAIFTRDVKLSFATINFNQIFRNQQGAMSTGGKVWFAQQGKEFKIISINP